MPLLSDPHVTNIRLAYFETKREIVQILRRPNLVVNCPTCGAQAGDKCAAAFTHTTRVLQEAA